MQISSKSWRGAGALAGITGTVDIRIEDGKHFYTLWYALAE